MGVADDIEASDYDSGEIIRKKKEKESEEEPTGDANAQKIANRKLVRARGSRGKKEEWETLVRPGGRTGSQSGVRTPWT